MNICIYDIEVYPNVFLLTLMKCEEDGNHQWFTYELSDKSDIVGEFACLRLMMTNLRNNNYYMVGYNNLGYDYPVLHHLFTDERNHIDPIKIIWDKSQEIINSGFGNSYKHMIWPNQQFVQQIDLMKIHHFDNNAKATSLKILEFNMRSDDIKELPYKPGSVLSPGEIDELRRYNIYDVEQTYKFYLESIKEIKFRFELAKRYRDANFINYNDTKIGSVILIRDLEKKLGKDICYYYVPGDKKRRNRQTHRDSINIEKILLPIVSFRRIEFNCLLDFFKRQIITDTKGVFIDRELSDLGSLAQYSDKPNKKGIVKKLTCEVDGFKLVYGTGGIHGSLEAKSLFADDDHIIVDVDVTSQYPSLAIVNKFYPEHLTPHFVDVYNALKQQRLQYEKGSMENKAYKLALNASYGNSNSKFSPFYDPKFTMSITINNQLLITMLVESLLRIKGLSLIQVNTDGITARLPRIKYLEYKEKCDFWSSITNLDLEYTFFKTFHVLNVNNYIGQYYVTNQNIVVPPELNSMFNLKIKRKGRYEYEKEWHQNHSSLVVPKAAEAFLFGDAPIEKFISNHTNMHDFMLRTKVPRTSKLVGLYEDNEVGLQNVTRYYVGMEGCKFIKIMPPLKNKVDDRRISILKDYDLVPINSFNKYGKLEVQGVDSRLSRMERNIDKQYYIDEVKTLTNLEIHNA